MSDTTDRMLALLREANRLALAYTKDTDDDERRAAYMAAKRELLAELGDEDVTR